MISEFDESIVIRKYLDSLGVILKKEILLHSLKDASLKV